MVYGLAAEEANEDVPPGRFRMSKDAGESRPEVIEVAPPIEAIPPSKKGVSAPAGV